VVRALEHSPDSLAVVASVSGGSIGSAYAALRMDIGLDGASTDAYDRDVLGPAYRALTTKSMMWRSRFLWVLLAIEAMLVGAIVGFAVPAGTIVGFVSAGLLAAVVVGLVFLGLLGHVLFHWRRPEVYAAVVVAVLAAVVCFLAWLPEMPWWADLICTLVCLVALLIGLRLRGDAIEMGIEETLFEGLTGAGRKLNDLKATAPPVFTSTNVNLGEAMYLQPGEVYGGWGTADPGDLPLVRAVRASANFPGAFPPVMLPTYKYELTPEQQKYPRRLDPPPKHVALMDGGVYDNMGSEWLINHTEFSDYLLVVNASRNLLQKNGGFNTFVLGDKTVLTRDMDIQYDASTAPRRRWLLAMFREAQRTGITGRDARRGMIVRIDGNLLDWASTYEGHDARATRATKMVAALSENGRDRDWWQKIADLNSGYGTTLDIVDADDARRLIRQGYLQTAVQLHVLEDYLEPESLSPDDLLRDILQ
jgi:predicted acylesterase/phospholipase RssA